jgi:hypothetical protein
MVEWWYWQAKPKNSGETCPSATSSDTNSIQKDPGANPGLRVGRRG